MSRMSGVVFIGLASLWLSLTVSASPATEPARVANVRNFGAVGDGRAVDTLALQKAVDDCAAKGGGVVRLPAGKYLAGTVELKSNVTLHLDDGATLLGTTVPGDYRNVDPFTDGDGQTFGNAFVVAVGASHVGIEGPGTIDGQGKAFADANKNRGDNLKRPFLVRLIRCTDVAVSDVAFKSSGKWTFDLVQCEGVTIDRLTIDSRGLGNNDGIDIDSCSGVRVRDCDIDSDDDAVCLKTTTTRPCRDIEVTGCTLRTAEGAFKTGTESMGDFDHIRVSNCRVLHAGQAGVQLFSVDGSHLHDVVVSDITMEHVEIAVMVRLGARLKTFRPGEKKQPPGSMSDVTIRNVRATGVRMIGILVSGIPGHPVERLTLENIDLRLAGGGKMEDAGVILPEKETAYPQVATFGRKMPVYGMYGRHATGLKAIGVTFELDRPDARPATKLEDCSEAQVKRMGK